MKRIVLGASILTFGLTILFSSTPASAQYGQQKQFGGTKKYDGKNKKKQESEFQYTNMDRPVSLPSLPQFSGKQHFISGLSYPNSKNGPGWIQTFNVENPESDVKSWWTNALRMHQWKITFTDQKTVRGKLKDGSVCTVTVDPPVNTTKDKMKNCRASYAVYYHQVKKQR